MIIIYIKAIFTVEINKNVFDYKVIFTFVALPLGIYNVIDLKKIILTIL